MLVPPTDKAHLGRWDPTRPVRHRRHAVTSLPVPDPDTSQRHGGAGAAEDQDRLDDVERGDALGHGDVLVDYTPAYGVAECSCSRARARAWRWRSG